MATFTRVKLTDALGNWGPCPTGVTRANVYLLGGGNGGQGGSGGGSGGSGDSKNSTTWSGGGGAGGGRGDNGAAGQWTVFKNIPLIPGDTYPYGVGAGGTAGAAGAGGTAPSTANNNGTGGVAGTAGGAGGLGGQTWFGSLTTPVQSTPTATNRAGGGGGGSSGNNANGAGGTASSDSASGGAGGAGMNGTGTGTNGTGISTTTSAAFLPIPDSLGQASNAAIKHSVTNPTAGSGGVATQVCTSSGISGSGGGAGAGRGVENVGTVVVHDFDPYVSPTFQNGGPSHPAGGAGGTIQIPADRLAIIRNEVQATGIVKLTFTAEHGLSVNDVIAITPGCNYCVSASSNYAGIVWVSTVVSPTVVQVTRDGINSSFQAIGYTDWTKQWAQKLPYSYYVTGMANSGSGTRYATNVTHVYVVGQVVWCNTADSSYGRQYKYLPQIVTNVSDTTHFDTLHPYGASYISMAIPASAHRIVSVADNGSGKLRVYPETPFCCTNVGLVSPPNVGTRMVVSGHSVSGYNGLWTVLATGTTYVDLDVSYTTIGTGGIVAPGGITVITGVTSGAGGKCRYAISGTNYFKVHDRVFITHSSSSPQASSTGYQEVTAVDTSWFETGTTYASATMTGHAFPIEGIGNPGGTTTNGIEYTAPSTDEGYINITNGPANYTGLVGVGDLVGVAGFDVGVGFGYAAYGLEGRIYSTMSGNSSAIFVEWTGTCDQNDRPSYMDSRSPVLSMPFYKGRIVTGVANNGSGNARLTTATPHNLIGGAIVGILGMTVSAYNGTFRVYNVTATTVDINVAYSSNDSGGLISDIPAIPIGSSMGYPPEFYFGTSGASGSSATDQAVNTGFGGLGGGGAGGGGGGPGVYATTSANNAAGFGRMTTGDMTTLVSYPGNGGAGGAGGAGGSGFILLTYMLP